jgi:hypothetical protein
MPIGYAIAGGSIAGGLIGASGAKKAAQEQAAATRYAADLANQQFLTTNAQQAPVRAAGYGALNQLGALGSGTYNIVDSSGNVTGTGTGSGYLTKEFTPEDFAQGIDPGYQFRLAQGQEATNRAANVGGGMISGNALKGIQDYTQGVASNEYTNYFNRGITGRTNIYNTLAGIAGLGMQSLNSTAQAGTATAGNVSNLISNAGAAQAAGTVGAANALGGGISNAVQGYQLSQLLAPKTGVNYSLTSGGYTPTSQPTISQPNPDMGGGQGIQLRI